MSDLKGVRIGNELYINTFHDFYTYYIHKIFRKNTAIGIDQWWIHEDLYCDGSDEGNPCNCCKPRPCPDMGCSRLGKEYSCFATKDVNLKIMECSCENKLCNSKSSLLGKPCKCCKYVKGTNNIF